MSNETPDQADNQADNELIPLSETTPTRNVPAVRPPKTGLMTTGRKTILSPELIKDFTDTLRICATLADSASYHGISEATVHNWIRRGKELEAELVENTRELTVSEQLFVTFFVEVEKARAEARIRAVGKIKSAMDGNWQAAAWYLERSRPQEWGRISRTEITGADGGAIVVDVDAVNRKLEALIQANVIDVEAYDVIEEALNESEKAPTSHEPGKISEPDVSKSQTASPEPAPDTQP